MDHSRRVPKPRLLDLRRVAIWMRVRYVFDGKLMLLTLVVLEVNKAMAKGILSWQVKLYHVRLRLGAPQCWIGGKLFNPHHKAIWLLLDMMHHIMLLAKRTNAKRDAMKFWVQEAKVFMSCMEQTRQMA